MYVIREYAGCVLLVLMLAAPVAALLFVACGVGHLLRASRIMLMRVRR